MLNYYSCYDFVVGKYDDGYWYGKFIGGYGNNEIDCGCVFCEIII